MGRVPIAEVLNLWDRAAPERGWRRALVLAGAEDWAEAAGWPLGERDTRVLDFRRQLFGSRMALRQDCPGCATELETVIDLEALPAAVGGSRAGTVTHGNYRVGFRVPDTALLARAEQARSVEDARRVLIEGCVVHAERGAEAVDPAGLPEDVVRALGEAIDEADPRSNVELSFQCAACGETFDVVFDAAACVWAELDVWARRRLDEVHTLATAYGWNEREILSLSEWRRQAYLEMVRQ
jgi:hypothetical protein